MIPLLRNLLIVVPPVLLLLWAWHHADRAAGRKPLSLRSFLAGIAGIPVALLLGWATLALMDLSGLSGASGPGGSSGALWMLRTLRTGGDSTVQVLRAFVVAGLVEEGVKLGAALLSGRGPDHAALRHGAAAGLGFALVEALTQLTGSTGFALLRLALVVPLHAALTGVLFVSVAALFPRRAGAAPAEEAGSDSARPAARLRPRGRSFGTWLVAILLLLIASGVHGAFNLAVNRVLMGGAMITAAVLIVAVVANGVVVTDKRSPPGGGAASR
ncbi:MAG: PrsW family glutamic-type intramembrane protease [Spirochaetota bacterium]